MTVAVIADGTIRLAGICGVDEAEALLQRLLNQPNASVDWSECEGAHTAVIQVLFVAKVKPVGAPVSTFLKNHIAPLLIGPSLRHTA